MLRQEPLRITSKSLRFAHARSSTVLLLLRALCALSLMACVVGAFACAVKAQDASSRRQTRPRRTTDRGAVTFGVDADAKPGGTKMSETNNSSDARAPFYTALKKALKKRKTKLENVCDQKNPVEHRVLEDYGAMFLASDVVLPPPVCMFANEPEVTAFQKEAGFTVASIGGVRVELQAAALEAMLAARKEARAVGLDITPRGGTEAARRTYDATLRLWNSRFLPALAHWNKLGRLSREEVERLRRLPLHEQVTEVLELEKSGIFFSKDFSKSILYSVAAPGTSQHLTMLAFDVSEFGTECVRRILAAHGWFQTVKSDLPHFTFLGLDESELPAHGLRRVEVDRQVFWIPNVD